LGLRIAADKLPRFLHLIVKYTREQKSFSSSIHSHPERI
jgi:hypothetical protein